MSADDLPADDPRAELAHLAASLRAYLEAQRDSGATGVPRGARLAQVDHANHTNHTKPTPPASAYAHERREPTPAPRAPAPVTPVVHVSAPVVHVSAPGVPVAPPPLVVPVAAPVAPAPVVAHVAAPVAAPRSLAVLEAEVASCTRCGLGSTRTNTVFSRGNPHAAIVFVGEAPGADEDAQGLPFVGRAGQLLDKMIAAMGLDAERDVYVCNIVKCRPPNNRRPEPEELAACMPYLDEQLANVSPKVIVAMGNTAVGAMFASKLGITRVRGEWKLYKGRIPTMPTYHPSFLLRPSDQQAEAKRQVWEDLQSVMKKLGLKRG